MTSTDPCTALIVDDEASHRLILKSLLKKQCYKVIDAVNGRETVDLLLSNNPSIIFMDVMMPEVMTSSSNPTTNLFWGPKFGPCSVSLY
jgi:CheY-like chemotaxis protein